MWKLIVTEGETKFGPDVTWLDMNSTHALDKIASVGTHVPPVLAQKIEELQGTLPHDKVAFYNRALGSYESFGLNRNGDGFERHELVAKHETFVKNAHYFRHHQNKDTALSRGRPVASAFNEQTEMVDLIIVADMDKCAEQIHALESGKRVPTSMGAKVAFDVCTICDNGAKTREDYCEHVHKMASAPYGMRAVLNDGRICGVLNPNPRFFDISDVIIGAAPESETLLKVASFGGNLSGAELAEIVGLAKFAGEGGKHAAITKRVPGHLEGSPIFRRGMRELGSREDSVPEEMIDRARDSAGFDGVLRNTAAMGIVLKPDEFARAAKLASFTAPSFDDICASEPMPKKILSASLDPELMTMFAGQFEKRSVFMPALLNRIQEMHAKTAASFESEGNNEHGKKMYAAYRRSLMEELPHVGGSEGEYWVMKCAETSSSMFTDCSRGYVGGAFLAVSETSVLDKVLDRMNKIAEPSRIAAEFGSVSGTVAEQIGIEALDQIAVQSLRNEATTGQLGVLP
jgi:hypothetical protein